MVGTTHPSTTMGSPGQDEGDWCGGFCRKFAFSRGLASVAIEFLILDFRVLPLKSKFATEPIKALCAHGDDDRTSSEA